MERFIDFLNRDYNEYKLGWSDMKTTALLVMEELHLVLYMKPRVPAGKPRPFKDYFEAATISRVSGVGHAVSTFYVNNGVEEIEITTGKLKRTLNSKGRTITRINETLTKLSGEYDFELVDAVDRFQHQYDMKNNIFWYSLLPVKHRARIWDEALELHPVPDRSSLCVNSALYALEQSDYELKMEGKKITSDNVRAVLFQLLAKDDQLYCLRKKHGKAIYQWLHGHTEGKMSYLIEIAEKLNWKIDVSLVQFSKHIEKRSLYGQRLTADICE